MEKVGSKGKKAVITELTQGKKHADELRKQLIPNPINNNPREISVFLVEKILSSYNNALAQLGFLGNGKSQLELNGNSVEDSPRSFARKHHASRKRKKSVKWSELVRASSGTRNEGIPDDGYSWRKYGQKIILGANHPRAYYRCTHKNNQGCLATKHVQQTDKDSSIFEVVYNENHSCTQEQLKSNTDYHGLPKNDKEMIPDEENVEAQISSEINTLAETCSPFDQSLLSTSVESCFSIDNFELDDIIPGLELEINLPETFLNLTPATFKFTDCWDIEHTDLDAHFL